MLDYREAIDRTIYENELKGFLPARIFDSHVHIGLQRHIGPLTLERRKGVAFFLDVCASFDYNPYEFSRQVYRRLYPEQEVDALHFGYPLREVDLEANNAYLAKLIQEHGIAALYMPWPDARREELEWAIEEEGFVGFKPYPDLAYGKTRPEIRIADYISSVVWEVANERGFIILIHPNRPGRLYDYLDIKDLSAASARYPQARIVVAHIGRPYIPSMIIAGIPEEYKQTENIWFDISPICESEVLARAIEDLGPRRLLFGTDSPFTYMRGRLGEFKGERKFFTNADYVWNVERESAEKEAGYTFYQYEQLRALKRAVEKLGLSSSDVEDIMYENIKRLVGGASHRRR